MNRLRQNNKSFRLYLLFLGALLPFLTLIGSHPGYPQEKNRKILALSNNNKLVTDNSRDSIAFKNLSFGKKEEVKEALPFQDRATKVEGIKSYTTSSLLDLYGDTGRGLTPIGKRTLAKESLLYRHPTTSEKEALLGVVQIIYGGLNSLEAEVTAQTLAKSAGYELVRLQMPAGINYLVLQPQGFAADNFDNNPGFGIFIFNPVGNKDIVLEAPHPGFDRRSTDLALVALEKIPGFALLIAGADRRANLTPESLSFKGKHVHDFKGDISDVSFAGNTGSLFHQVHLLLTTLILKDGARPFVYQFHGFGKKNDGKRWPDFVLSNGNKSQISEPQDIAILKEELQNRGYSAGIYCSQHPYLKDLSGSHNPQAQQTMMVGGTFVHIEAGYNARKSTNLANTSIHLAQALGSIKDIVLQYRGEVDLSFTRSFILSPSPSEPLPVT